MEVDPDRPESMPRDCHPKEAINPHTGDKWVVHFRDRALDRAVKLGPGAVRELGFTTPEAILNPTAIFQGDNDEGEPDWLCYVSRPSQAYDYRHGSKAGNGPGRPRLPSGAKDSDPACRAGPKIQAPLGKRGLPAPPGAPSF